MFEIFTSHFCFCHSWFTDWHVSVCLSEQARRKQAVEELVRILRPGGCVLIYVWAQEQQKDQQRSKYLKPSTEQYQESTEHAENIKHHSKSAEHTEIHQESKRDAENTENHQESKRDAVNTEHRYQSLNDTKNKQTENRQEVKGISQTEKNALSDDLSSQNVIFSDSERDGGAQPREDCDNGDSLNTPLEDCKNVCGGSSNTSVCCAGSSNMQTYDQFLPIHINRTEFKVQDMLVPWRLKKTSASERHTAEGISRDTQTLHRFYHVFRQGELDALCAKVCGCVVTKSYYDQGNWCVVLHKCWSVLRCVVVLWLCGLVTGYILKRGYHTQGSRRVVLHSWTATLQVLRMFQPHEGNLLVVPQGHWTEFIVLPCEDNSESDV